MFYHKTFFKSTSPQIKYILVRFVGKHKTNPFDKKLLTDGGE